MMQAAPLPGSSAWRHFPHSFRLLILLLLLVPALTLNAQEEGEGRASAVSLRLDRLPPDQPYLPLMRGWLFHEGDNLEWADPAYPDTSWQQRMPFTVEPEERWELGTAWWRMHFVLDSSLIHEQLSMVYMVYGAFEVYLDGELLLKEGEFKEDGSFRNGRIVYFPPPLELPTGLEGEHLLAIRVNRGPDPSWMRLQDLPTGAGFVLGLGKTNRLINGYAEMFKLSRPYIFLAGLIAATGVLALILFFLLRSFHAGLYFGLFGVITSLYTMFWLSLETDLPLSVLPVWHAASEGVFIASLTLIILFLQASFKKRNNLLVYVPLALSVLGLAASLVMRQDLSLYYYIPFIFSIGWILVGALRRRDPDAIIATVGFGLLMVGLLYDVLIDMGLIGELLDYNLVFGLTYPWPAVAMIVLLARQFSRLALEADRREREALALRAQMEHSRLETVQQLSKAVAHEFNSPLAIIQGYLELTRQDDISLEKKLDYMGRLPTQVDRMKDLVRKLMRLRTLDEVDYAAGIKMLDLHGPPHQEERRREPFQQD